MVCRRGAVFWLILFSLPAHAAGVGGAVVDPAGLPIPGAVVELTCGNGGHSAITDVHGWFRFAPGAVSGRCNISVSHPQFASYRKAVSAAMGSLTVRLELAPVKQTVTVSADGRDDSPLSRSALGSVSLSEDQLRGLSNNAGDLVRYAKLLAGAAGSADAIYVDGLPSGTLPPAQMIAGISVNADPFSAEYSDGDQTHIDIVTKSPDRELRVNFGGGALGVGGRNALAPGAAARSDSENWTVSGPVPFLPVAFSAQAVAGNSTTPIAIEAAGPPTLLTGPPPGPVTSASHNGGGGLDLYFYPAENAHAHLSYSESRFGVSNVGAGGSSFPRLDRLPTCWRGTCCSP